MATIPEALQQAVAYHQAGQLHPAEQIYRRILDVDPTNIHALHLLGVIAYQAGHPAAAVEHITQAIRLNPQVADFHNNLGTAYEALKRSDEAAQSYRRALQLNPKLADAHSNLGLILIDQGKTDEAEACFRQAVQLRPNYVEAYNNLGMTLHDQGKSAEAEACYRQALALKPDYAEALSNLGLALKNQGELEEAVACCRRAIEILPNFSQAYDNLGIALQNLRRLDEAMTAYNKALEINPDSAMAHWNRGLLRLLMGQFEQGWPEYEWRWQTRNPLAVQRSFSQPAWDGQPNPDATILLHSEQGLGDTIQFVRYASLVKSRVGRVILECQPPLARLLANCPGVDQLIARGTELPAFDAYAPLLSVPRLLGTTIENIPADVPYLSAAADLVEQWRERIGQYGGFRVGISWQGTPTYSADRFRSIPLAQFAPLSEVAGVRLISLQKGVGAEQLAGIGDRFAVIDLTSELDEASGPFMDTAALMQSLDLVITSDTAVAHLAGALGVPVWVALPFVPDWRWLLDRDDSPWYPTMRLFRQTARGDWAGVFQAIQAALAERVACNG